MNNSRPTDPAEQGALRLFYRDLRPTRLGRWINRFWCWWSGLGLSPKFQAALLIQTRYGFQRTCRSHRQGGGT